MASSWLQPTINANNPVTYGKEEKNPRAQKTHKVDN